MKNYIIYIKNKKPRWSSSGFATAHQQINHINSMHNPLNKDKKMLPQFTVI